MTGPRKLIGLGLGFAATLILIVSLWSAFSHEQHPDLVFVSSFDWNETQPRHGGYSGFELNDDGQQFVALSDRPAFTRGRINRQDGKITSVSSQGPMRLASDLGNFLDELNGDSEALAASPDFGLFMSLEGRHAVNFFPQGSDVPVWVELNALFDPLPGNKGLEALALSPDGYLLAIPETWEGDDYPVFRLKRFDYPGYPGSQSDGSGLDDPPTDWEIAFRLPRLKGYAPVGADFGPDGALYLLERRFVWPVGFSSAIRRFNIGADKVAGTSLLLKTPLWRHQNLEAISVWSNQRGEITFTMISDDNFRWFLRTEIVEYRFNSP